MNGCHRTTCRMSWLGLMLVAGFSTAWAHIDIEPKTTIPNRWETFILNVPTETESPTVEVQLAIPEGFEVEAVGHRTDWHMALRRDSRGFVHEIVWSGGQIPPLTFEEFKLLAKAAKSPGAYEWHARQRYADDQESTWALRTLVQAEGSGTTHPKSRRSPQNRAGRHDHQLSRPRSGDYIDRGDADHRLAGDPWEGTAGRMRLFIEYWSTLLHLIGLLLLAGGHLWLAVCAVKAEQSAFDYGQRFLLELLPTISTLFGVGVLLLFASGMAKLLLWYEPGFVFLPLPYGWILLTKLMLYMAIVVNGIWIERRHMVRLVKLGLPEVGDRISAELATAWTALQRQARLNFVLIMVVVAFGETLRFAKM